jgi:hypothetical protein
LEPAKALTIVGPVFITVDALGESAEESSRKALLDILAKGISDLPPNFRILVLSQTSLMPLMAIGTFSANI